MNRRSLNNSLHPPTHAPTHPHGVLGGAGWRGAPRGEGNGGQLGGWIKAGYVAGGRIKKTKNVYVCLSLNDAIYHEMLYQQMRMSTYVKSNAYVVLKSSTTDRCTIVSFLTNR